MSNDYQEPAAALKYLDFLNSPNGQIQKTILFDAIKARLPEHPDLAILDAGCGPGWLSGMLKKHYTAVQACDSSEFFIRFAKTHYKGLDFKIASLEQALPYQNNYFDFVILNMVGPDIKNLKAVFQNASTVLKPNGRLIMAIPNPQYTFPIGQWKRSWLNILLLQKPQLKLKPPPAAGEKIQREFTKNSKIDSYYYPLDSYIQNAKEAGLRLKEKQELRSKTDSKKFDLNYQMSRYPLLLLLEGEKISK